jgi:ABC-type nitrate/sulfonate/bicarbonate transport system permease component
VLNFAALATISLMGVMLFFVVALLERVFVPWAGREQNE